MEDNLARELSYCIAELYEGLDEVRAEMAAMKVALKAGLGGADKRLVRAERMPDDLPAKSGPGLWEQPEPERRRRGACSERDGDSIYGRGSDIGDPLAREDESSGTAIRDEQREAILRLADSLDGIRDTLHQMLDRYRETKPNS